MKNIYTVALIKMLIIHRMIIKHFHIKIYQFLEIEKTGCFFHQFILSIKLREEIQKEEYFSFYNHIF